ncbi:DeoR/GlpR family DNA-binding transcription regulator [Agaribacter marinus]|uniref:DeoR family transcriptional regulator n=1 Tax=Agaribacter marinus TaxID=1431249 RepID=A0AA37SVL7_9ALTE|nr:DeoR/GlpR family DNA-binding transcription regulator [Agaribacter marinus]GLR70333.1 DeoR family transcriptional regulator [Agaribacter marinus]
MLTKQRKQMILAILAKEGKIIAKDVASSLNLSEDTIRRDLRELAKNGLLQRVHGGALPASPAVVNFVKREEISNEQKVNIGRKCASLIKPGQIVIIDGGTTAVQLARHLPINLSATIVTHSPNVAVELISHDKIDVEIIGGRLYKHSMVSMGVRALENLAHIQADVYFMGVTGVHIENGLTTGDLEEAYMKRALSDHAAETIVMASDEKIHTASAYLVLPTIDASAIVVNKSIGQQKMKAFTDLGINVIYSE